MRLIDADALIEFWKADFTEEERSKLHIPLNVAIENLRDAPTVDAVERKRGEWKEITDRTMDCCYRCSECGFIRDAYFLEVTNFCPNCGADMRKVKEE